MGTARGSKSTPNYCTCQQCWWQSRSFLRRFREGRGRSAGRRNIAPFNRGCRQVAERAKGRLRVDRPDPRTLKGAMFRSGGTGASGLSTPRPRRRSPSQSSQGGRGWDKPNGRSIERTPSPPEPGSYESARLGVEKGDVRFGGHQAGGQAERAVPSRGRHSHRTRDRTNQHEAANEKGDVSFGWHEAERASPSRVSNDIRNWPPGDTKTDPLLINGTALTGLSTLCPRCWSPTNKRRGGQRVDNPRPTTSADGTRTYGAG